MRRSDVRAQVPVYRRTPENSVDSFSSSEEDEPVEEHRIDEHSAAAPSLIFSSIYGPRPNSINRLQLANVDLPVSPESLPHTPPRTSRPTSHQSTYNHVSITSPNPTRPLSSSLGIGIGGRAQGGLAEVFAAIANTQAQAQSTALPPSSAGSLPSPLSLSPKSPPRSPRSPANVVQEIVIKDEGYSLEQLPFKLTLSNQSSLLLNRTSRAAQRRSSTLPQRQDTSSSSGVDREKRPTNLSAPERLSISSLPKHPGDRPISVSSIEHVEEEGQADDEQDEEDQEIVDESPSLEALQPYPRDVSTEPSPDPTRQGFIPPAPMPPPPPAQPPKPHARNNSARHIDHELVIDELEERLGVEPTRRRRARSNAVPNPGPSATSPNRSTSQPTGKKADATWERKPPIQLPNSNVDMGAARNMLNAMFAKREQQVEEKNEEHSSDEHSFLPVDWDVGSMAGLDEEELPARQEAPAQSEPAVSQRKSSLVRRQSTTSQARAPIPTSQPVQQLDAHPQTPSTACTIPETPNTQVTHSTQPTPPSDHAFDETDTEDEHPEDLADLIEAEPIVLRTPRSVVLRREVGRETSLPSRTGTGSGTPGAWTPRPGSGAWTPSRGSIVGGGLQIIESPTVERRRPTISERRQSASGQRLEDISQSTISEATLNTVSGRTENMSPVSRPLVSDRASVSAPVAPVSFAPILGPSLLSGNGLGLSSASSPSGLGSGNGLGSGVSTSDIVSPSPSTPTPLCRAPLSDNVLGLGTDSGSTSSVLAGLNSILPVAGEQVPQAAPATSHSQSPFEPTSDLPAAALVSPSKPSLKSTVVPAPSSPVEPSHVRSVPKPKSITDDPVSRAEPDLPTSEAKPVVLQQDSGSAPSVELGSLPPSSESNIAARANPSIVAGPDFKDDLSASSSLDRDPTPISTRPAESSGVPVEPIRDTPHTDRTNLDAERVVPISSHDMVIPHVPKRGSSSGGEGRDSPKLAKDLHGDVVQGSGANAVQEDGKEVDEVVVKGRDRVEALGVDLVDENNADSNEVSHEDSRRAVHRNIDQGPAEERARVTNISSHQDTVRGATEVDQGRQEDARQEQSLTFDANISKVEPAAPSGDSGARALVSDSEMEPVLDVVPDPTSLSSSALDSPLPDAQTGSRISQLGDVGRETAQDTPQADEVAQSRQALLGANQDVTLGELKPSDATTFSIDTEGIERSIMGQDVTEFGILDQNPAHQTREQAAEHDSTVEQLASKDALRGRATLELSTTSNPPTHSESPSPVPVPELVPTSSLGSPIVLPSASIEGPRLEPDHIDSLSELEESFAVRSPVMGLPLPELASLAEISAHSHNLSQTAFPVPEQSPMLPPLEPLAPFSPVLPSSASVSPSPPEPLSPPTPSSPPTTSSPPASPSLAEFIAPPTILASEPQLSKPRPIPSSTKDLSEVKPAIQSGADPQSQFTPLESEQHLSPELVSNLEPSISAETSTVLGTHVSPSRLPSPHAPSRTKDISPAETSLLPKSPPSEPLLSPTQAAPLKVSEVAAPERAQPDLFSPLDCTTGSETLPAHQSPPEPETISLPEALSSPNSTPHHPSVLDQSLPSPQPFLPLEAILPESIPLPNSSPLLNAYLPNVSLPLEPSPPRHSSLSGHSPLPEPAELPGPSLLSNSPNLRESSPLITPLFEPSPWPGLSVMPKPSPSPLPISSPHEGPSLPAHPYSPGLSPLPNPGSLPDVLPVPESLVESTLPPTEDLQGHGHGQPVETEFLEVERPDELQGHHELPVTPNDHRHIRGAPDPLSPWGSLRLRRSPGVQGTLDDEQQLPKSSLLFDYASLPADSPPGSRTPLPCLPPLPEDPPLLEYAPPVDYVHSDGYTEQFEGDRLSESGEPPVDSVNVTFAVPPEHPEEPRSHSPVECQLSQRSSLSEIPSLSDFTPPPLRSDTAPQYVRTATLASEPRAASELSSKPRPRSQLKPLRLSLLHGLGTLSPGAIITPVSANTVTPSPGIRSEVATPTPTAMYPTPSSAHPSQPSENLRSGPQSPRSLEGTTEANAIPEPARDPNGLDSVSWFGAKKGVKRGTLSATRESVRQFTQGSNRSSPLHDRTMVSPERNLTPAAVEPSPPHSPAASAEDEDVRPLPMIWDDETEVGSRAGSSRQGTQSSTRSQSHVIPVLEAFPPDTAPTNIAPPLKTPDRLDTVPRYPMFVNIGTSSPRVSEGRSPLPSPPAVSEHPSVNPTEAEAAAPRSRKWADTVNQESIGSLPDFNAPAPSTQMLEDRTPEPKEPHTPSKRKDRRHYMKIPNTAPLSISPRRVSPSIMQRDQASMGSYEQSVSSQDEMQAYATPHTAPLDLRSRMPKKEGTTGPWMAEHYTNSPSSFHSSQFGSMHSASSSLSTRAKAMGIRHSVSNNKQVNGPVHVEDGTFGKPGPGPSTMKAYSERRQSAEVLGSPIALQSSSREGAASAPKTPEQYILTELAKRVSGQLSSTSIDATPRKLEDALQLKVSSAETSAETEMTIDSGNPDTVTQLPIQSSGNEVSPPEKRTAYKALSLSSPSPVRQPPTPFTAPSPLQILRRNLMARTSPESPRFLSPQTRATNLPEPRPTRHQHHASASLAPTSHMRDEFQHAPMSAPGPRDRRSLTPNTRFAATPSIPGSPAQSVHSTISQTKPLLFFAIAKNSAQEVERLLQDGEVKPNDKAGPEDLPALAFALANEQLSDKTQIVKSLLSHGADPSSVLHRKTGSGQFDDADLALTTRIEQGMNPAIRYYLNRKQMTIPAPQAELLEKNNFGGLTRAGFSIIGQDAALEELIRVVAGHCRRQALNPLVVVFSGGPGCGKSLLASKIGPLLHVPYFTVNMTNLRNEAALFNYISMTTKVGQPQIPLVDFLRNNQGQRCVVVLEEIEKAADKTVWHSLLMPWEWGKATVISPTSNEQIDIDTSQVIWIATSNSGDDATLKFFAERSRPSERGESALVRLAHNPRPREDNFTRKDYLQLMQAVRKRLGELLGSSMISRVSSVLPFLPFTEDEVYALASESLSAMRSEQKGDQSYEDVDWEELLQQAVGEYIPGEGARSVHRAVQRAFDEIAEW